MDMKNMNAASEQAKGACKRYWKKGLAGVVALAVLGGCGALWSAHQHEAEHAAKDAARTQLIAAQAAREDITLLSEDEAKAKAAEAVGVEESALTFKSVGLENLALEKKDGDKKDRKGEKDFKHGAWGGRQEDHDRHEDHGRDDHEREGHDGMWQHEPSDHDGMHRSAPQGRMGQLPQDGAMQPPQDGEQGQMPMMPQGAMQGQPPMGQGVQPPQNDSAQPQAVATDGQQAQATEGTNGQPPMQRRHFGFHPAYKIACSNGDVKYHVMIDAVSGDVMMCDVA